MNLYWASPEEDQTTLLLSCLLVLNTKLTMENEELEELREEFLSWYRQMCNQDPEFPTNFDIADWWINKVKQLLK